ncbi:MAG: type I secretion system permease/ATPase [Geobacter sp.]|nr:type I secretion system permease/ATPase [Geobacter sp.]
MNDSGFISLILIARHHGIAVDEAKLLHEFGSRQFSVDMILRAAKRLGMTARLVEQDIERLELSPLPAIAIDNDGNFFVAVRYGFDKGDRTKPRVVVQYADATEVTILDLEEFKQIWSGQFVFCISKMNYMQELSKFDFSWFIPAIVKYRKLLAEVLVVSFVIQLIGLATPLGFQVVMDKVLVNNAMKTLHVIVFGLCCAVIFENTLTGIRTWVFARTSSKIDVELGARLYRHLLALPIAYFQSRRVGDSVARVRELENIRSFLTGNAITLVLDLFFSIIFLLVMFWYSVPLSLLVLCSLPLYFILSLVLTPILRNRLKEKFETGARSQAFLVESISGVNTIKSMAVEPRWIDSWEKQLASYVTAGLNATNIGTIANTGVTTVSKLVSVGIILMGASLVIEGKLTVGQLIAFNMLSGRLTDPILRIAQLWNNFQQVGVSMERLGDILDAPREVAENKTRLPKLHGAIEFDQVSFRYRADTPDVIRSVNVRIEPGQVIGIVGRSGSGKSTLTRLIQRLYTPDRGRVLVDGHDLSIIDTTSLRHQLGVVLQENLLFSGSIRENIALSNQALPIEHVIAAAKLSGAHEFICDLPEGYDTYVGEHGASLSGGQRQRIAIARALITNPRVLIFDEATSALDYESEQVIQQNMQSICAGRTVIVIAHRLSAVRHADRILVMERGQIVEDGPHDELLRNVTGIYHHLYNLQLANVSLPEVSV